MPHFERFRAAIDTLDEQDVLDEIYRMLPSRYFSADVLERVPSRMLVMEVTGVTWSDWGRPDRIFETLSVVGRKRRFSTRDFIGTA